MTFWNILRPFGLHNLQPFGVLCGHLVYFFRFGMFGPRKLWQPWLHTILRLLFHPLAKKTIVKMLRPMFFKEFSVLGKMLHTYMKVGWSDNGLREWEFRERMD
jgi:hypothetical protein